jgi:hypothetical protein
LCSCPSPDSGISHCGTPAEEEAVVGPIKRLGAPALDAVGPIPYAQLNATLDGAYPGSALNYWKSSFLSGLGGDAVRAVIDRFAACPTLMGQVLMEHFRSAVTWVSVSAAFPRGRLRAELRASAGDQGEVRSPERLPPEPGLPADRLTAPRGRWAGTPPAAPTRAVRRRLGGWAGRRRPAACAHPMEAISARLARR